MFFYSFTTHHGFDRVVKLETQDYTPGDLLLVDGKHYMLCLGKTVAFQSLYEKQTPPLVKEGQKGFAELTMILIEPQLLQAKTISFIHNFVAHRFTTYKNTLPLFLSEEIDIVLKRKPTIKTKKAQSGQLTTDNGQQFLDTEKYNIYTGTPLIEFNKHLMNFITLQPHNHQRCIIFPNVRTMRNTLDIPSLQQKPGFLFLFGNSSQKQKDDAFRAIKNGTAHTLICTYSQIFQDWHNLGYILLFDQHTRYYKNQQDPKYHTLDVCHSLANFYGASLDFTGINLTL